MRYYGSTTLIREGNEHYNSLNDDELKWLVTRSSYFKKVCRGDIDSWFLPYIAQYWERHEFNDGDLVYLIFLYRMIYHNDLKLALYKCSEWAYPDMNKEDNIRIIKSAGFDYDNHKGSEYYNSDGFFSTNKKVELLPVGFTDDDCSKLLKDKSLSVTLNSIRGVIEIGYTHLCKTVNSLINGETLLRLPYEIKGLNQPMIGLLYNANPKRYSPAFQLELES